MHNTTGPVCSVWACACNSITLRSSPSRCTPGTQGMGKRCEPFLIHWVLRCRWGRSRPDDCVPGKASCMGFRSTLMAANMWNALVQIYTCCLVCIALLHSVSVPRMCWLQTPYMPSIISTDASLSDLYRLGLKCDQGCNRRFCAGHMGAGAEQKGG